MTSPCGAIKPPSRSTMKLPSAITTDLTGKSNYYGRTSGVEIWAIYRCPQNGRGILDQRVNDVMCITKRKDWSNVETLDPLIDESLKGWFDEDDKLPEHAANSLVEAWAKERR